MSRATGPIHQTWGIILYCNFVRGIAQYVSTSRDPVLFVASVVSQAGDFGGSALFGYKINWQPVMFVGYGDDRELDNRPVLRQLDRPVFIKLSYAFNDSRASLPRLDAMSRRPPLYSGSPICNAPAGCARKLAGNCAGIVLASAVGVSLPGSLRIAIMLLPLTTTATRLHAHRLQAPDVATQEVNRCLKLVKIAASRRKRCDERLDPPPFSPRPAREDAQSA